MRRVYSVVLFFCAALFLVSCSKDYRSSIPASCQALLAVDVVETGRQTGLDEKGGQAALQSVFMVDDIQNVGVDFTSSVYLFETSGGDFGLVAKVDSKSDVAEWFSTLEKKGVCKGIGEKKGYPFYVLKESFVASFSGNALMIMGPAIGSEWPRKQQQMVKYLDAEDGDGIMQSKMFERIETMTGAANLVARASALPQKFAAPITLGAPKGTDASEVMIAAEMNVSKGLLNISGDVFSFNSAVDEALKKANAGYRKINGRFLKNIPSDAPFFMLANVNGAEFLKQIRTNEALRTMLLGINTVIDIDKMISSVDGDMAIVINKWQDEKIPVSIIAEANSSWTRDVEYWEKSNPAGTITHVGGSFPQYTVTGESLAACFGMADNKTMYISTVDGMRQAADVLAETGNKALAKEVTDAVSDKRMCLVVSLDAIIGQKQGLEVVTNLLKPLFGNVHTLVYSIE